MTVTPLPELLIIIVVTFMSEIACISCLADCRERQGDGSETLNQEGPLLLLRSETVAEIVYSWQTIM